MCLDFASFFNLYFLTNYYYIQGTSVNQRRETNEKFQQVSVREATKLANGMSEPSIEEIDTRSLKTKAKDSQHE